MIFLLDCVQELGDIADDPSDGMKSPGAKKKFVILFS